MGCGIDDDDDDDANNNNNSSNNNKNDADNNNRLNKIYNWLKNFTNQLLDNIWGDDLVDMQLISLLKDLDFYCALLIFLVNMLGLFL